MSILTYQALFERFTRTLAEDETGTRSTRLKFPTDGAPTVYLAYVFEDWGMASIAAGALATCGVDIYADWSAARLFEPDEAATEALRDRLGRMDAWLVALVSERTKNLERLRAVLDLGWKTVQAGRYALLPVRYESPDWKLPPRLAVYPRIESRGDDLVRIAAGSTYQIPLRRWFSMSD
jgi:hypothetical protein